jgi:hypothetical protein
MSKQIFDVKPVNALPTVDIIKNHAYLLLADDGTKKKGTMWTYIGSAWVSSIPTTLNTDIINESTTNAGVTIEGVLVKDSAVSVDTINEKTSTHGVIVDGVTLKDSGITSPQGLIATTGYIAGIIPFGQPDALTTSGTNQAVSITKYSTVLTSTGTADKISIVATGVINGQLKKLKYGAEGAGGDTIVLTPSVTTGFATCTFNAVNDYVVLMFNGTYWQVIENSGCTIA